MLEKRVRISVISHFSDSIAGIPVTSLIIVIFHHAIRVEPSESLNCSL